jgi:stage III sporulation protein AE
MSSFDFLLSRVADVLGVGLEDALRLFATLLGLVILSALLRQARTLMRSAALSGAVSFCCTAAMIGAIVALQYDRLSVITAFLSDLNLLASSMIPLMGVLYAMGGNLTAAVVNNSGMMIFLTVCENLINRTVLPVTALCMCFAMAAAMSPSVDMKGVAGVIKKSFTMLLCFIMTLLMTVLAAQSTLAAASDGIAARTAKFVAGNFIPVVGGTVGDSLRTVAAGIKFMRANVGVAGIIIILLMLLPPLISVLLTRLAVMLSSTAARMLGCGDEAALLGELSGVYGYLLAVISACSVMFIFALTLLTHTSAAVGG